MRILRVLERDPHFDARAVRRLSCARAAPTCFAVIRATGVSKNRASTCAPRVLAELVEAPRVDDERAVLDVLRDLERRGRLQEDSAPPLLASKPIHDSVPFGGGRFGFLPSAFGHARLDAAVVALAVLRGPATPRPRSSGTSARRRSPVCWLRRSLRLLPFLWCRERHRGEEQNSQKGHASAFVRSYGDLR